LNHEEQRVASLKRDEVHEENRELTMLSRLTQWVSKKSTALYCLSSWALHFLRSSSWTSWLI